MLKNIFKSDYALSAANKVVAVLTNAVYAALVNRTLGATLKGEYAYILNVLEIAVIIFNLGFYQSYPKNFKEHMPNIKQKYMNLFALQFVIYLIVALICGVLSRSLLYTVVFLIVPIQILATQLSMITLIECIKFRQIVQITSQILKALLLVLVYILSEKNLIYIFGALLVFNLYQVVSYFCRLRCRPSILSQNVTFIREVTAFGFFATVSTLLILLNYKLDILMLTRYVDYTQIGLYSVGAALAEFIWLIPDIFKEVLFARTSRSDAIDEINMAIRISMLVSVVMIVFMVLFGKWVLLIYAGEEFSEAYKVTNILFLGIPSMALFKITNPLYLANGKQKMFCAVLSVSAITNIIMNIIMIPKFGIEGAAFATVVSFTVCGLAFYIKYIIDYGIKWYEPLLVRRDDIKVIVKKIIK